MTNKYENIHSVLNAVLRIGLFHAVVAKLISVMKESVGA
jgi:hypothetical protein